MAPVGTHSSSGSRNLSGKKAAKARVPPSLNSIKSLPAKMRLMESSSESEKKFVEHSNGGVPADYVNLEGDQVNDDSPYGDRAVPFLDEDSHVGSSPLPSIAESKWNDTASYAKKKSVQAWYQLPDGNWELGKIISASGTESIISLPEGKVVKVQNDCLLPANPDILDGVDDLMQLSYLNEPSVLYNLQYRYDRDMIYTKAGPVLVAINPFKKVQLYGNEYIEAYKRKSTQSPHVYAIADTALREMKRDEVNQSIIIRWVLLSYFLFLRT